MTDLTLKNLAIYGGLWLLNGLVLCLAVGIATGHVWGFAPGGFFEPIKEAAGGALGTIGTGLAFALTASRPKLGREDISKLVNEVGSINARAILADVVHGGQQVPPLSDDELRRMGRIVVDEIREEMGAVHG